MSKYIGEKTNISPNIHISMYIRIISLLNNAVHTIVVLRDFSRLFTTEAKERKLPSGAGDEIIKADIALTVKMWMRPFPCIQMCCMSHRQETMETPDLVPGVQ